MSEIEAPFKEGQIVMSYGNEHFGKLRILECRWIAKAKIPYWRVYTEFVNQQANIYSKHSASHENFYLINEVAAMTPNAHEAERNHRANSRKERR